MGSVPTYEDIQQLLKENRVLVEDLAANAPDHLKADIVLQLPLRNIKRIIKNTTKDLEDIHNLLGNFQSRLDISTNKAEKTDIASRIQSTNDRLRQIYSKMLTLRDEIKQWMFNLSIPLVPEYDEEEHFIELFKEVENWLANYPEKPPAWMKRKWNEFIKTYNVNGRSHWTFPNSEAWRKAMKELEQMRNEFTELPQYQSTPPGSPPLYTSIDNLHFPGSELTLTETIPSPKTEKKSFWSKWMGRNSSSPLMVTNALNIAQRQRHIPGLEPAWNGKMVD